jgi:hypothetical protein
MIAKQVASKMENLQRLSRAPVDKCCEKKKLVPYKPGDYKEISPIIADQWRPRIRVPMRVRGGGGLRGLSQ